VVHAPVPIRRWTSYQPSGALPVAAGAVQEMRACPEPRAAARARTGPGVLGVRTAADADETGPVPTELRAATRNTYDVFGVSDVTG
jgi:hypothetical protein